MNLSFGCKYTHRYPGYPASTGEAFLPSNIEVWFIQSCVRSPAIVRKCLSRKYLSRKYLAKPVGCNGRPLHISWRKFKRCGHFAKVCLPLPVDTHRQSGRKNTASQKAFFRLLVMITGQGGIASCLRKNPNRA